MAYIAAVNPAILVEAGMPFDAALTSTCFGAAFSLLMSDFFDTMGGVVAVGRPGGFANEKGEVEDLQPILAVDSLGAAIGGFLGASSITVYVESAVGAAAGARTGLSNIVIAALFVLVAFFSPLVGMVSGSATCGALAVVGYLMMTTIGDIDWSRFEHAFPAFLIVAGIPFTYSITDGIGLGFIAYVVAMVVLGRARSEAAHVGGVACVPAHVHRAVTEMALEGNPHYCLTEELLHSAGSR